MSDVQRRMESMTTYGDGDSALRVQHDDGGRVFLDPPASRTCVSDMCVCLEFSQIGVVVMEGAVGCASVFLFGGIVHAPLRYSPEDQNGSRPS